MGRIDKENYYLDIAETVMERSTCGRSRYGAIIVHNDEIVSTGYNAWASESGGKAPHPGPESRRPPRRKRRGCGVCGWSCWPQRWRLSSWGS